MQLVIIWSSTRAWKRGGVRALLSSNKMLLVIHNPIQFPDHGSVFHVKFPDLPLPKYRFVTWWSKSYRSPFAKTMKPTIFSKKDADQGHHHFTFPALVTSSQNLSKPASQVSSAQITNTWSFPLEEVTQIEVKWEVGEVRLGVVWSPLVWRI